MNVTIAVMIPCFNEEKTVSKVISDFRLELPSADIYVYNNASTDNTEAIAVSAGATVRTEHRKGKGNVVRSMFRDVEADIYVMVDGDATYPADKVHALISPVISGKADMTVGTRLRDYEERSFRLFHRIGNRLVRFAINILFGTNLTDVLSGYRCFSSRCLKSIPILSNGFEVETEITLQALDKGFTIMEIPVDYYKRPPGSFSKLNTYLDGLLIIKTILFIFKDYRPLKCFSFIGLLSLILGVALGTIPISDFVNTGKVTHPSTAVLATGLVLISLLAFVTAFILDTISRRHQEQCQLLSNLVVHHSTNKRNHAHPLD